MSEFEIVEAALGRYRPVGPSLLRTREIAASLGIRPSAWTRPWFRVAAAMLVLSVPVAWAALRSGIVATPPWGLAPAARLDSGIPQKFVTDWMARPRVDMPGRDAEADVVVVGFNDWQCPGCLDLYAALKGILAGYERTRPGAVALRLRDWPWDMRCNREITVSLHKGACEAAVAVRAARDRGKGDEMIDWLRANYGRLTAAGAGAGALIEVEAKAIVAGLDFQAASERVMSAIGEDVAAGAGAGVNATPTYFINGIKLVTLKAEEIDWAIATELRRKKQ